MTPLPRTWWIVLVVSEVASCAFDPAGTGSQPRRGRGDSVRTEPDSSERANAAEEAAERLRSGGRGSANAGEAAGAAGVRGSAGRPAGEGTAGGGTAGRTGAVVVGPSGAAAGGGATAVADAGVPRLEEDAGDDSDSGAAPVSGTGGAAGSMAVAGAGGAPASGASGSSGAGSGGVIAAGSGAVMASDREIILSLLDIVISVLQVDPDLPAGELLIILASASTADPALLAVVLDFLNNTLACAPSVDACARACEVVQLRCDACVADASCAAALAASCGGASCM